MKKKLYVTKSEAAQFTVAQARVHEAWVRVAPILIARTGLGDDTGPVSYDVVRALESKMQAFYDELGAVCEMLSPPPPPTIDESTRSVRPPALEGEDAP